MRCFLPGQPAACCRLPCRNKHAPALPRHAAGSTPAISEQLAALGGDHIGYGRKRFPALGLTLLGGRPFSKGGKQWSDVAGG